MSETAYPTIEHIMEVTAFKDHLTALAAIETLKWLEDGAPHKFDGLPGIYTFDMGQFIHIEETDDEDSTTLTTCGTACCIAGAMSMYKRYGDLNGIQNCPSALDEEFGSNIDLQNVDPLSTLFYPGRNGWVDEKTVGQAAKALRGYLETGKTVWS